jgi:hypothetical protein
MPAKITHYLDSMFVAAKGRARYPKDLSLELRVEDGVVVLEFLAGAKLSESIMNFPLLEAEAQQLGESLLQLAEEARGNNEEDDEPTTPSRPGR